MSIITLTTDLGLRDYYAASLKGTLLTEIPKATVVDISHQITRFDISEAAFTLKNAFLDFPKGSIHIAGVKTTHGSEDAHLLILYKGHYFIGSDNGLFSLVFDEAPEKIYRLPTVENSDSATFVTKSIYAKAAARLAKGDKPEKIGTPSGDMVQAMSLQPLIEPDQIRGTVQFVDSYGNLITNISEKIYDRVGDGRTGKIQLRTPKFKISSIKNHYSNVPEGETVAFFGSSGFLEISINFGSASKLLGMQTNEPVIIDFS